MPAFYQLPLWNVIGKLDTTPDFFRSLFKPRRKCRKIIFGFYSLLKNSEFGWRSVFNAAIMPFVFYQGFSPRGTWMAFFWQTV